MRIIIAIDIIGGKCVRLTKGDFKTAKIYNDDPVEVAKQVKDNGLRYLHLVDLDGALSKRIVNHKIIEKIVALTDLEIDFGGGIRSEEDINIAFNSGAKQITCGSIAVTNRELVLSWINKFGSEKIILGADAKNRKIATEGWIESSGSDVIKFISDYVASGIKYTICTDVEKDGMLGGPSTDLYKEIVEIQGINLIASGGITTIDQIKELDNTGCEGAIVGKALYEGLLNLHELGRLC